MNQGMSPTSWTWTNMKAMAGAGVKTLSSGVNRSLKEGRSLGLHGASTLSVL